MMGPATIRTRPPTFVVANASWEEKRGLDSDTAVRPAALVLSRAEDLPAWWRSRFVGAGERPLYVLARALAQSSSGERELVALVVREGAEPALVLVGFFSERGIVRARALQRNLPQVLARLRYVSYRQAEEDCERLAQRLVDTLGRNTLARCSFVGIPRGGLIVLGMLSYVLGLRPDQFHGTPQPGRPLVIVDDCALTGYRFGRFMGGLGEDGGGRDVVFAHLYSPPDVRERIASEVPRMLACCAAHDLEVREEGAEMPWEGRRYGRGTAYPLAFAWSEPDMAVRDEDGGMVRGWRLVPPSLCLAARFAPDPPLPIQVQKAPPTGATLRLAPTVVYARFGAEVIVADLATEEGFALEGTAAALWLAIAERGTFEGAVVTVREAYSVDEQRMRHDARAFARELQASGLLEVDAGALGTVDGVA
jgi:hypothetical protein